MEKLGYRKRLEDVSICAPYRCTPIPDIRGEDSRLSAIIEVESYTRRPFFNQFVMIPQPLHARPNISTSN